MDLRKKIGGCIVKKCKSCKRKKACDRIIQAGCYQGCLHDLEWGFGVKEVPEIPKNEEEEIETVAA